MMVNLPGDGVTEVGRAWTEKMICSDHGKMEKLTKLSDVAKITIKNWKF